MLNGELVARVKAPDAASSWYGMTVLGRLMLRFENVATPPTALTGFVPESTANGVPVPEVMLSVIDPVKVVAVFPNASWAVTTTGGAIAALAAVLLGCPVNVSRDAAAGFTVTVVCCVTAVPAAVADTVFDSATVDERVPVATPLALVVAAGWVSVLPVPVAAKTTVAPWTRLPN